MTVVASGDIYSQEADLFVPCALGGIINDQTINQFKVKAIAGSANNQLLHEDHGQKLQEKGILYAPDYIINSGGLIHVADELYGFNHERVLAKTKHIYDAILEVYKLAKMSGICTMEAANTMCEKRMESRSGRNSFYTPSIKPKWAIRK